MIPHKLSEKADEAAARYDQLTSLWQAYFSTALSAPDFGNEGQSGALVALAYQSAEAYMAAEKIRIDEDLHEIAEIAHQTIVAKIDSIDAENLSDAALAHLSETFDYIHDELVAQINRDIALMRQSLQRAVLEVGTIARARGMKPRAALVLYRVGNPDKIDFTFTDRRARRTPSSTFIRALFRQTLLGVYNETVLHTLSEHGIDRAAVMRLEEGVALQIDTISLAGEEGMMGYGEARGIYFHPNSNAWLDLETDDV